MCIGMTADFHRLNILLVRLEDSEAGRSAKKVATVTMSNAQINARLSKYWNYLLWQTYKLI